QLSPCARGRGAGAGGSALSTIDRCVCINRGAARIRAFLWRGVVGTARTRIHGSAGSALTGARGRQVVQPPTAPASGLRGGIVVPSAGGGAKARRLGGHRSQAWRSQ